jgi:outer membrane protein
MRSKQIAIALSLIVALLVATGADAQDKPKSLKPPVPSIAIVDIEVIMSQSLAVQSARTQIDQIAGDLQQTIAAEEEKLRAEEEALRQQRTLLTPEVYAERRQALQERAAQLQQRARALRQTIDRGMAQTMQLTQRVLFEEIGKLAEEIGVNLVLPRSQIVVAIDSYNISEEALKRLNARLSEVEMALERKDPAEPGKK